MESGSQILNQLPEVHTLISDIVEDGLVAIALILHIANLHLQTESLGNHTTLYHRRVLASLRLAELLHINLTGNTVNALDVISRFQIGLLDLQFHQSARQCHHADIMSGTGFYRHDISLFRG